jgi:rhodanese-related sulfurtransferase
MMKRILMLLLAGAMFAGAESTYACGPEKKCATDKKSACCSKKEDAKLTEAKTISKTELASMIETKGAMVIDARDADSYTAGHIDGAVNYSQAQLPADKSAALVFYCGGTKCPAAQRAANKAIEEGYTNVMVFRGGWAEWQANG